MLAQSRDFCNQASLSHVSQSVSVAPVMRYFIALSGESLLIRLDAIIAIGEDEDGHAIVTLPTGREAVLREQFSRVADDMAKSGVVRVVGEYIEQWEIDVQA